MELQQSPPYAKYIRSLHWTVESIDGVNIFINKWPLIGGFAKMQRLKTFPTLSNLLPIIKKYSVKRMVIEAAQCVDEKQFKMYVQELKKYVNIVQTPFLPSKTILIDLTPPEEIIFHSFTEAKRRAVRKALKNNISSIESDDISKLIKVKNKSAGLFGFITTSGAKEMWKAFSPNNATTVLAFEHLNTPDISDTHVKTAIPVAGIFLIFWEDIAYYWIAGATNKGKKLSAPTLLVWEAVKIAKRRGMKQFDFVGVWDERFPKDNKDWLGFTKFKEGFGGNTLYYPSHK